MRAATLLLVIVGVAARWPEGTDLERALQDLTKVYHCHLGIVASPDSVVQGLKEANISKKIGKDLERARSDFINSRKIPNTIGTLNVAEICSFLNINANEDAIFTNGAGNFAIWSGKYLNYSKEHRLLAPQAGAMGAGLPAAMAAKSIYPNRQVICFADQDSSVQLFLAPDGSVY